ncbi:hypothetical protein COU78_05020 [Candidatus Peregrinibacteria bacterium CG10_big_fil_rev_8_21_14_0_10_49_24]|nr:MAG: hypothetical protein COU78_05020 [Candidatus Peregrinibacteria bacterium CG10_big_fil_rev_8_21_14_0_10_49_24]
MKSTPFHVIAGVQYEIEDTQNQPLKIAQWFHRYYSHIETDSDVQKKIIAASSKDGFYETPERIYVVS